MFRYLRSIGVFLHCLTVFAIVMPLAKVQKPTSEYERSVPLVVMKHPAALAVHPRPRESVLAIDRSTG